MKKFLFFILLSQSLMFASCDSKNQSGSENSTTDSTSVPEENIRPTGDQRSVPNTSTSDSTNVGTESN